MSRASRRKQSRNALATAPAEQSPGAVDITSQASFVVSHRSGPLPDPEELAAYNNVVVDGAERIFRQFELQSDHRRDMESRVIRSDIARSWVGIIGGFVLDALLIAATWDLVRSDHEYGLPMLGATIVINVGIVGVSYKTQRERRMQRESRQEDLNRRRGR